MRACIYSFHKSHLTNIMGVTDCRPACVVSLGRVVKEAEKVSQEWGNTHYEDMKIPNLTWGHTELGT